MKFSTFAALAALSGVVTAAPSNKPFHSDESSNTSSPKIKGKWFDRFVVIIYENNNKDVTFGEPYWYNITELGMVLGNYHGTTHPSQPNYITMISNTIAAGVYTDADHNTTESSLIDLFEPKGITWKAYQEGYYPLANGACNPITEDYETFYVRKHNPFMSFDNIRENITRCQNIVNAEEHFEEDVAKGLDAPMYMFITPNLKNDAHDTNVTYAAANLQYYVDTMLNNEEFMKNTMILITFDENDIYSPKYFGTDNHIYSVLLGNDTLQCYNCNDQQYYNHFSQVVTIEQNWDLGYIAQPDGSSEGWDQWWLPFGLLRNKDQKICENSPCSYFN